MKRLIVRVANPLAVRNAWLRGVIALLLLMFAAAPAFAIDPLPFHTSAERVRFQHLTRQLRCMVCQDESLLSSNADFAKQLRHKIFAMMQEGKSNAEIKQYLVARYSNFILYDPPLSASTIALWFGTPAIFLLGAGAVVVLLRRRTRPAAAIPDPVGDDW
jgi:cytochrome c-type biogenesis protein CcmH